MTGSTFLFGHIMDEEVMYYSWDGSTYIAQPQGHLPCYPPFFLRTNAVDLTRLLAAVMNDGELDGQRILQPATIDTMLTLQYPGVPGGWDQGLTWQLENIGGREVWGHSGGGSFALASMMFDPTQRIGAVAMANSASSEPGEFPAIRFVIDALLDHAWRQTGTVAVEDPAPPAEDANTPARTTLDPCYPNPFNPMTTVTFSLPRSERTSIGVYDLTGRCVAELVDAVYDAGSHAVTWNGRDARGREVPSGTYVIRMATAERVVSRKATLVR
jgi:hypothetical protein